MRFNQDSLKLLAKQPGEKEGRFMYKSPKEGYHSRWVKLKSNLLFIFKSTELGTVGENEPMAVLVLEGMSVRMELPQDMPFVFSLCFQGEGGKKHYFAGQTEQLCQDWVTTIGNISHTKLKAEFDSLRAQVKLKSGKDPLEEQIAILRKNKGQKISHRHTTIANSEKPSNNLNNITSNKGADRLTVGASSFYEASIPQELKTYFKDWQTFD